MSNAVTTERRKTAAKIAFGDRSRKKDSKKSFLSQTDDRIFESSRDSTCVAYQFFNDRKYVFCSAPDGGYVVESTPAPPLMCLLNSIGANSMQSVASLPSANAEKLVRKVDFDSSKFTPTIYARMDADYYDGLCDCIENIIKLIIEPRWLRDEFVDFLLRVGLATRDAAKSALNERKNAKLKNLHTAIGELAQMLRDTQVSTSSNCTTHLFAFRDCDGQQKINPVMALLGRPNKQAAAFSADEIVENIYAEFDSMLEKKSIAYVCGFAQVNMAVRRFFSAYMATRSSRLTIVSHPIMATIATCTAALNSCQRRFEHFYCV